MPLTIVSITGGRFCGSSSGPFHMYLKREASLFTCPAFHTVRPLQALQAAACLREYLGVSFMAMFFTILFTYVEGYNDF